jgi:serine/threonine-protein kinase
MTETSFSDRNLLFGIVAFQLDFVSRDELLKGMTAWAAEKSRSLGEILVEQEAMSKLDEQMLNQMVERHIQLHGDRPEASLATVSSVGSLIDDLQNVGDSDLNGSLVHIQAATSPTTDQTLTSPHSQSPSKGERFRILRPHANGGLGKVSLAVDEQLHREVALKEIQEWHADNQDSRSRFLLEAEITGGLEHPGIVPVYGLGYDELGRPFYAMRFIKGDSLTDAIDQFHAEGHQEETSTEKSLTLRKLLGRFVDVCHAIAYAHSRGILHRDLKPANIMLGKYGETLVVDWGLARTMGRVGTDEYGEERTLRPSSGTDESSLTTAGAAIGTPRYMSPEQAKGEIHKFGPQTDVYGLGAILYTLLTGKSAFTRSASKKELLEEVARGVFSPPRKVNSEVPPALEAIVLKAMALNPEDRYATPGKLADDVERWLADEPVSVFHESWLPRVGRVVRKNQTVVGITAASLVVGLVGLAAVLGVTVNKNRQLRVANAEVRENLQEAQRQTARAEQNLLLGRNMAADLIDVAEQQLVRMPRTEDLRKQLTSTGLEQYKELVEQRPDDEVAKFQLGRVYLIMANVHRNLREHEEAEAVYKLGIATLRKLDLPELTSAADDLLASSLRDYANMLRRLGRLQESLTALSEASQIIDRLQTATPKNLLFVRTNGSILLARAAVGFDLGRYDQCEQDAAIAADCYERLLKSKELAPQDQNYRFLCLTRQSLALLEMGKYDEANAVADTAVAELPSPEKNDPNTSHTRARVLLNKFRTGVAIDASDAMLSPIVDECITIWTKLSDDYPKTKFYKRYLCQSFLARGEWKAKDGWQAAESDIRYAVENLEELVSSPQSDQSDREALIDALMLQASNMPNEDQSKTLRKAIQLQQEVLEASPAKYRVRNQLEDARRRLSLANDSAKHEQ